MLRATAIGLLLLAAFVPVYLRGCAGPRPSVTAVTLDASPAGLVPRATVRNRGGAGQIEVRFRIRDLVAGRVSAAQGSAELERDDEVEVRSETRLPPGKYAIEAEAEYPPR